jgi:hypothetical protein
MTPTTKLGTLTDTQLLDRLTDLVRSSRGVEAELVAHIGEVDARRLYLGEAAPSMFVYATHVLHLSEAEAYLRIAVARASRRHPALLAMLAAGQIHLSGAGLLAPHLTLANREAVLARAVHKSKREIEELIAELAPRPSVSPSIRRLPEPRARVPEPPDPARSRQAAVIELRPDGVRATPPAALAAEPPPAPPQGRSKHRDDAVEPIAPARYRVQFTASETIRDKLERLQALVPGADLAALIEQAVTEKLERLEGRRFGRTKAPSKSLAEADTSAGARHIPAPVRRAVYERDGGRCAFVASGGRRCDQQSRLEFHHRRPHGYGGERSPANISLLCRSHNLHLAEIDYGKAAIDRHRRGPG